MRRIFLLILLIMSFSFLGCATLERASSLLVVSQNEPVDSNLSLEELWVEADGAYQNGEFEKERNFLKEIAARIPDHHYALFRIGKSYFTEGGKYKKTVNAINDFLAKSTSFHPSQEEARYLLMRTHAEHMLGPAYSQEYAHHAINEAEGLLLFFPNTKYREEALAIKKDARSHLAAQSIFVARFYIRTRAYTSARLRLAEVLNEYQNLGYAEEAMRLCEELDRLEYHPTGWDNFKRWLLFRSDQIDLAKIVWTERWTEREQREQELGNTQRICGVMPIGTLKKEGGNEQE